LLVLASTSPRRRDLLCAWGYSFTQLEIDVDEEVPSEAAPWEAVREIACRKARAGWRIWTQSGGPGERRKDVILAADTIVVLNGSIYGKPADRTEARATLQELSGKKHEVITAVAVAACLIPPGEEEGRTGGADQTFETGDRADEPADEPQIEVRALRTSVGFRSLNDADIETYLDSGEWTDKAAAYGIQGLARVFVYQVQGSETNVIGLPRELVGPMLADRGIYASEPFIC